MKKIAAILIIAAALTAVCRAAEDGSVITYLSDMEWKAAEIYSDANGGVPSRDENVAGEELWLYDLYFEKGVCLHAAPGKNVFIEVDIEGKGFRTFYAYPGTAESELYDVTMASVNFIFKVDGKTVLRTEKITPKKRPEPISFDVTGAKLLRIEMTDGGDGISGDWGSLGAALFSTSDDIGLISAAIKGERDVTAATEQTEVKTETEPLTEEAATEEKTGKLTEAVTEKPAVKEEKNVNPAVYIVAAAVVLAAAAAVTAALKKKKAGK